MRKDKEVALQMRREGKTYQEIKSALKISKGTLSSWFRNLPWAKEMTAKLKKEMQAKHTVRIIELNAVRGGNLSKVYEAAEQEAIRELELLKYHPLFLAGVVLYWGEGGKSHKTGLNFSNTDPGKAKFFVTFLKEICQIPEARIRAHLVLYPDHEERICRSFWSKMSGLPPQNFTKSTIIGDRHATRRLSWGVCRIDVGSTYLQRKMLVWTANLPKELMDMERYAKINEEAAMV